MEAYLKRTVVWYGGVGLLTSQVFRSPALPPKYFRLIVQEIGVLGGMLIMYLERGADVYAYWNITTYWVVPKDFLTGVGKSVFFGVIVTLIGCYNGLSTEGGTEGLGRATTGTVVHVTMGVIVSDFFITKLFLTLFY